MTVYFGFPTFFDLVLPLVRVPYHLPSSDSSSNTPPVLFG